MALELRWLLNFDILKWIAPIFFLSVYLHNLYAQSPKDDLTIKSSSLPIDKVDTISFMKTDLLKKVNSLSDSLPVKSNKGKIDSLRSRILILAPSQTDSLTLQQTHFSQRLDSVKGKLTSHIDSLKNLKLPDEEIDKKIASLSSLRDSLDNIGITGNIKEAEEKLTNIKSKAQKKIADVEPKINEKLSLLSKNGGNVPGELNLGTGNLNLPSTDLSLPGVELNTGVSMPENPLNGIDGHAGDLSLPQAQVPGSPDLDIPQAGDLKIPDIKGADKLADVQSKTGEIGELTGKVKGYQEDIGNIAKGDPEKMEQLSKDLESKVARMDELGELQKYDDMMKRYQDPLVMKEEALNKAKETAVNHFIGHEEELKAAMEQFAKVRSKIPDPDGVYDMLKPRSNPQKGKPFIARLVPGITLQFQKPGSLWVDFNPQVTYKLTGRFNIGLGWNERVAYDTRQNEFDKMNRIFGVRSFIHFKVKPGLWLKGDVESMNAWIPSSLTSVDQGSRNWIWSYFGGVKKDFQFSKHVIGNVQVMYNLYDPDNLSPYANRINIRMGFEFPLSKKKSGAIDQ